MERDDPAEERVEAFLAGAGPRGLRLGRVIGRGGMGTVREGEQRALRRRVAIKHTDEASAHEDREALVREAWLTAALGHPNIVPVHELVLLDGQPHVVMKHVDGVPWGRLLGAGVSSERVGAGDPLGWHLRVLITVCNAVAYAHDRGLLHLDLKPDNVMIGSFGEVWVVDWGLARRRGATVAPDEAGAFGTPACLAPEMAQPGARLDVATDVYLLGGLLLRVVAGRAPRTGRSHAEVMEALRRPVQLEDDLPLVELLRRCLAQEPEARPGSALGVREAIEAWLEHRRAHELVERASRQLMALTRRLAEPGASRAERYDLYGACRFGFEEALRSWPEAPGAAVGRRQAIELMARAELDDGDDRAAELLLALLDDAPPELVARLDGVRAERLAAREELRRIRADNDPRTAWGARMLVALPISGVFVLTPIGTTLLGLPQGYAREIGIAATTSLLCAVLMVALAPWVVRSRLNRVLVLGIALGPTMVVLMHVGCWLAGVDSQLAGTLELFVYFLIALVATLLAEYRMWPSALGYLLAYYLAMGTSGTTLFWMNLANLALFLNVLAVWVPAGVRNEMPEDVPLV